MREGPIIFFDGICNLCHWAVRFILHRDSSRRFLFASLQSKTAANLLPPASPRPDSVVLYESGTLYYKSDAALRIARFLRFPWSLFYVFTVLPRPLRDWIYDLVASRRYRWFGQRDLCHIALPEESERFMP
jgi:predicted DCC family thiol-disulfide oxidoreductase YuxK